MSNTGFGVSVIIDKQRLSRSDAICVSADTELGAKSIQCSHLRQRAIKENRLCTMWVRTCAQRSVDVFQELYDP